MKHSLTFAAAIGIFITSTLATALAYPGQQFEKEAKVTLPLARVIALRAVPGGKILKYELEREAGGSGLQYDFEIKAGTTLRDGEVVAQTPARFSLAPEALRVLVPRWLEAARERERDGATLQRVRIGRHRTVAAAVGDARTRLGKARRVDVREVRSRDVELESADRIAEARS